MAVAALAMTNCSHEEEMPQVVNNPKSFTATIEGASRSAVTDEGVFSWTAGDEFSVWNGTTFDVYANSEADVNTFVAEDENASNAKDYAIYPAGSHSISNDDDVTVNLPATYPYGSTNAVMLATIEGGSTNLAFKHLGGLMHFYVENVPANATSFVFTATNDIITGNYTVDSEGEIKKDGENNVNNNNSVTISFEALTEAQNMTFYVPLPVGTYGDYKVEIKGESINLSHESTGVTNTIGRRTLLLMPTFTVEGNELKKGAGSVIGVTAEEANVSGNQSLTIDATDVTDATAILVLNYTPQEGNATLSLSDGSDDADPQASVATVKVAPTTADVAVEALNINTPTLTVELGAGQYGTVEALTATQTLKIGSGVTIGTLVLNGGNLEVDESATIDEIVVKGAAGFADALTAGAATIVLASDIDLALTTGNFLTIPSGKEVSIDLNGKTLTTSGTMYDNSPDDITVCGTLTIKNGSIKTANTAIWANGGTLTMTDCNLSSSSTTGAAAVCVSSGTLTITGGSYTGSPTETEYDRYVIGVKSNSTATISNATVQNGNGGVTVTGGSTATLTGGSYSGGKACGLYVGKNSSVTYSGDCKFSGVEGDVVVYGGTVNGVTYTEYTNMQQISTVDDLKTAITNGGYVILASDIDLALTTGNFLTIPSGKEVSIDLNGKTLTTSGTMYDNSPDDITVCGTLTIKNGSIKTANTAIWANGGTLTMTDCNLSSSSTTGAAAVCVSSGTLTITGGSYTGSPTETEYDRYVIGVKSNSTATISNATVQNGNGGVTVTGGSTATLTGGSYSGGKACGLYVGKNSSVTYSDDCEFSGVEGNVVVGSEGTVNGTKYQEYTKVQ